MGNIAGSGLWQSARRSASLPAPICARARRVGEQRCAVGSYLILLIRSAGVYLLRIASRSLFSFRTLVHNRANLIDFFSSRYVFYIFYFLVGFSLFHLLCT